MLTKFHFQLESVLKVKQIRENQEKAHLVILQKQYQDEETVLQNLQDDYLFYQEDLSNKSNQTFAVGELQLYSTYFEQTARNIKHQESTLVDLEEKVNGQRRTLLGKVRERKVLENLKEKKRQEFKKQILQEEQKFLDEIATNKYARPSES